MSVMKFNGALNVDISKWASLKMIREDHLKAARAEPTASFGSDQTEQPKYVQNFLQKKCSVFLALCLTGDCL